MGVDDVRMRVNKVVKSLPAKGRIRRVSLFGSHLHGKARDDSDIDLLIEVVRPFSLFQLVQMQDAFEKALGKKVDLVTPEFLSPYFRDDVLREATLLYEER